MKPPVTKYWAQFVYGPNVYPFRLATRKFVKAQEWCNALADMTGIPVQLRCISGNEYAVHRCEPAENMAFGLDTYPAMEELQRALDNLPEIPPAVGAFINGDPCDLEALCAWEKDKGDG